MATGSSDARLIHMANQIARNFAVHGAGTAARATADHIVSFWDPRMKARLFALADGAALEPIAARAVAILNERGDPGSQTPATVFGRVDEDGGSDAG